MPMWYTCPKTVTHPSTNQAQRRVTLLMQQTMLPLRQAASLKHNNGSETDLRSSTGCCSVGVSVSATCDVTVSATASLGADTNVSMYVDQFWRQSASMSDSMTAAAAARRLSMSTVAAHRCMLCEPTCPSTSPSLESVSSKSIVRRLSALYYTHTRTHAVLYTTVCVYSAHYNFISR